MPEPKKLCTCDPPGDVIAGRCVRCGKAVEIRTTEKDEAQKAAAERERMRSVVRALMNQGGPMGASSHEVDHGWNEALNELLCRLDDPEVLPTFTYSDLFEAFNAGLCDGREVRPDIAYAAADAYCKLVQERRQKDAGGGIAWCARAVVGCDTGLARRLATGAEQKGVSRPPDPLTSLEQRLEVALNEREVLAAYREAVAHTLEKFIRPLLPDSGDYKITLIARAEGDPEADILVTQELDLGPVMAAIRRGEAMEAT